MCITRGEVLQIYEELGIFCWIAYKCFCLLTLLGCGIPFLDKPSEQSSSATGSGTAHGGLRDHEKKWGARWRPWT